jgi:tRNA modification GTPase
LAPSAAALVSPQPGTTRDYLTARLDADGLTVELIDTAGVDFNPPHQSIDEASQTATATQQERAILRLLCLDSTRPLTEWEQSELADENTFLVFTKCDLAQAPSTLNRPAISTSSRTGAGLDQLRAAIRENLLAQSKQDGFVAGTSLRVQDSVRLAAEAIHRSGQLAGDGAGEELIAAELRSALAELGKIVGAIYTDDLLDRIFSRFCIGK